MQMQVRSCRIMRVLQYQVSAEQSTIAADVAQHYVPPPPYFASVGCNNETPCRRRKYAWWCVGCGALAAALGGLLAAQHILLRAYTASPQHLETVPAAVPAAMLVLTGVCIMSLARRRNRYSYMVRKIKVVGACCLVCALTCVLVTITTTVIHMNKLQTLKFCEYTKLTRTCTCFSMPPDSQHSGSEDEGVRCVFEGVTDCGVVHGALYWCLRGVFALSVSAVLVCIFSCMLAYQLLSHERKKMYWEQLELRCRSLYRPPAGQNVPANRPVQSNCSCCTQCHPTQPAWDISLQHRFWAPGRIGNLYSPNPGTGRKTSAWSWFPWPRNSQNSRHRMGAPQSGDSAYGFCEPETNVQYDQTYPGMVRQGQAFQGQCGQASGQSFQLAQAQSYPAGASFDAQTGVWGPPPPYSPQGRSGSRHHLQQDPATATLLHHHHIDVHRNSMQIHDHPNLAMQPHHPCRNSYIIHGPQSIAELNRLNPELSRINPELSRLNPELARMNPELHINPDLGRMNTELTRLNTDIARINPELIRINPELARLNPDLVRINPDLARMNPELSRINPEMRLTDVGQMPQYPSEFNELTRLQAEMSHLGQEGRFNTLRGHLVPHRNCQRSLGLSAGNLHGDCRNEDIAIECLHQKSASKVSDQSSDSGQNQKQGKENLGFQNDKHSPLRASMQECNRGVNQNAESEVYFADVSSCCNVSVKTDCCLNPNVSALVGTIENHPESTSESDTGSFTLTRQQRPQPQVGSKRRPQKHNKSLEKRQDPNSSLRLTEQQIEQLNNSIRMNDSRDRLNETRLERMNEARMSERMSDSRDRLDNRCVNECRDQRMCDRMNDSRLSDNRFNDSRISDRMNETRMSERINESRIERLNDSRISDRMIDRMNESRTSERLNDSKLERSHDSRISERMTDILNDSRMSDRMNESRFEDRRLSDMNSSLKLEGSPKIRAHISPLRIPRTSPKNFNEHLRQGSSDSGKPEFFVPPPPALSPLTPNTEESLLSDDDNGQVYSNDPESSKCLAPDSQYEVVNEEKPEALKGNHHHCYSDTNTMDSGWQSGSEKQVTD